MLGSLIAAGANIVGGLLGANSAKKAQNQEYERQKEFAQSGIQWKVEDAKKAGIHPLYALGASTSSYAPQSVGGTDYGLAEAGQNIGRAVQATQSEGGRIDAFTKSMQGLQLQKMGLENELLASQIATQRSQIGPPMPAFERMSVNTEMPVGPLVTTKPMERAAADPLNLHQEAGSTTSIGYGKTPTGYAPQMSYDFKQRNEDDFFAELAWALRNRVAPMVSDTYATPPPWVPLAPGHRWWFNPFVQEYQQFDKSRLSPYRIF